MRVCLLTGPGGDAQGWGDMNVTRSIAQAAEACGHSVQTVWIVSEADFRRFLDEARFDLLWSALYTISDNEAYIGWDGSSPWIADALDARGLAYVGSTSRSLRDMLDKSTTHRILEAAGVPVPANRRLRSGEAPTGLRYPLFVKPVGESRSVGISEASVVHDEPSLHRQVAWIEREFGQPALVEEFLPGLEYTCLVLGNGADRELLAGQVSVEERLYGRYRILRAELRGVGLTRISSAGERGPEVQDLAARAAEALGCRDFVRIDIKQASDGALRVIEVNGIPGLKPHKSWAPQLYSLHHRRGGGEEEEYRELIGRIIDAAARRYGLPAC